MKIILGWDILSAFGCHPSSSPLTCLWSWLICVIVTGLVSLATKPKPESELAGFVYGATDI
jgi:hypothetical protein